MTRIDRVAEEDEAYEARHLLILCTAIIWVALLSPALAPAGDTKSDQVVRFDISRQRADRALIEFAEQADVTFIFPADEARKVTANAVRGEFTPEEAIEKLLEGTGLQPRFQASGALTVNADDSSADEGDTVKKRGLLAGLIAALAGSTAVNADASEAIEPQAPPTGLEEIIVTAQKFEQTLFEVPISIVALTAEQLEARQIEDFEDLGLAVPGLSVADEGPGARRIYLRGIGNNFGTSALVGVYLDEVSTAGHPQNNVDLQMYDLVLRGPQGTLYGQGSVGGTIRVITKEPDLNSFAVQTKLSASLTRDGAPSERILGVVNLPLAPQTLGLRMSGIYENTGGWIDQPGVAEGINDQDLANIRIKGLWQPSETVELNVMANVHRNDAGATSVGEDAEGNYTQVFGRTTTPATEDDYEIYNLTAVFDLGKVSVLSTSSYLNAHNRRDEYGSVIPVLPPPVPPFESMFAPFDIETGNFNQELRVSSNGSGRFRWSAGGFFQDFKLENSGFQLFGPAGTTAPFALPLDNTETSKAWAVFGSGSLVLTDRVEFGAGLRYFEDRRRFDDYAAFTTQEGTFDSFSPRVSISVDASESTKVYASIAKGFRSGGFNTFGAEPYDPEEVWTYELGAKATMGGGVLDAEVAVYYSQYDGYQINALLDTPVGLVSRIANIGDAEINGVDGKLGWRVSDRLTLEVGGNYTHTEVVKINALSASHEVGDPLDFVPEYQLSISAIRDFVWNDRYGYFQLDYNEQGRSTLRLRNIGPHFVGESDVINMLNFTLSWQWSDHVGFSLFAENLLNERGFLDPSSIIGNAVRPRPRTVGFQIAGDF